ncbi:MAG: 2'-5' RNA ligase [Paraglaciecola sp.]|jgi:2'-5' RNA ligase
MRLFFALEPTGQDKLAIEYWRNKALPCFKKSVPPANFHITLAFLGQTTSAQLDALIQEVDKLSLPPIFAVHLSNVTYWPKPKVLCLACEKTARAHSTLAHTLNNAGLSAGLSLHKREYHPHLTLARKCPENPPAPIIEPSFSMDFSEFHLFESVSTTKGVMYQSRCRWSLPGNMNI